MCFLTEMFGGLGKKLLFCKSFLNIYLPKSISMKKIFTAIVAMVLAVPSFAQFASGGFELDKANIYYGARFGLALGSLSGDTKVQDGNDFIDYSGMKAGFTLAGIIGLRLSESAPVFLESGLYYTQRGGKSGSYSASLNCLEIPLLVKYGIKATDDIAILPFVGPYFAYGISGTREYVDQNSGKKETEKVYEKFLNHNDMGFKLGCGVEYNLLYLEVAYQIGVANIADNDNNSTHANQLSINFGVNF